MKWLDGVILSVVDVNQSCPRFNKKSNHLLCCFIFSEIQSSLAICMIATGEVIFIMWALRTGWHFVQEDSQLKGTWDPVAILHLYNRCLLQACGRP